MLPRHHHFPNWLVLSVKGVLGLDFRVFTEELEFIETLDIARLLHEVVSGGVLVLAHLRVEQVILVALA